VRYLRRPLYESLLAIYGGLGAALLWLSYRHRQAGWSTLCEVAGLLGLVAGLMIWLHRRDYRATGADYMQRGRPVGESRDEPP
jgi:hypothetical protein